jgi:tetratricopeptide (TPR) repeat protein
MPTVINGIGTWYYGKRRIHTIKGVCEFCGNQADLTSYDTTLFFVVVFVPVIPIGQKRILRQCSSCKNHKVLSLAKWEQAKELDGAELLEKLQSNTRDRDTVVRAIGFSLAYQDEPLFNSIVETISGAHAGDAAIQAQLGDAYSYFAHWEHAEAAYRASLEVADNDLVREQLAWTLLKQDRPDEARPYLQHVIDNKKRDSAGTVYFLVKGYQAQGRHEEALAIMDERDQAFPDWAALKDYQQQRKVSTRYQGTDKKIRSELLTESAGGYREGNWTWRLPHWLAALVLLGGLACYLGWALWIGQARTVYLVNGTNKPYTVVVQGTEHAMAPNGVKPIHIAEGDLLVTIKDAKVDPVEGRIETSFWTRPFAGHTFIINPDQSAVLLEEETYYAKANPRMGAPPKVHFGRAFYSMPGVDYEFQEFPATVQVREHSEVRKTRVSLPPSFAPEVRLGLLQGLEQQEQMRLCQTWLRLDPNNSLVLFWLTGRLSPDQAIAFLEPRLEESPILVDWHRMYQMLMERAHPETDLLPRYRKLLADSKGNVDALYLLGRANPDRDEGDKLMQQAASATPPSGFAQYSQGYRAMTEARFAEAAGWFEKALGLLADKTVVRPMYYDALLANHDYDPLLEALQKDAQMPGRHDFATTQIVRVHAIRGDKAMARQLIVEAVQSYPPPSRDMAEKSLESMVCCCENDVDGYLKAVGDTPSFPAALLRGRLKEAADLVGFNNPDAISFQGLLYLEASRSGAKELADAHWGALLAELKKGGRDHRVFADVLEGRKLPDKRLPQRLPIEPTAKRVLLAVMAQRYPDQNEEMLNMARQLDFHHDAISLCLHKFLQKH